MVPSPPKATRTSPRKKAWGSPGKATKHLSTIFKESDFSPLNASWASITESDVSLNESLAQERAKSESRRKPALPKKVNSKPKFVRSLELTAAVEAGVARRSERIKVEDKAKQPTEEVDEPILTTKNSRKRCLSSASTITMPELGDGPSPTKRAVLREPSSSGRPARKTQKGDSTPNKSPARTRLFNKVKSSPSQNGEFKMSEFWEDPSLGWCKDEATLQRRTRELDRAKEKPVYARYLDEVPRHKREKHVHPRTPNKYINFSRRSWDQQVRNWKRNLYAWAGEEASESANTSFCSYSSEEMKQDENEDLKDKPVLQSLKDSDIKIESRPETDAMASLLGHFDLDSRRGAGEDESTLKAGGCHGPVDFSNLQT